jgi:hypothetical protein
MSLPRCAVSAFLSARGPAVVPFRPCCVLAVLGAREAFVCDAALPTATLLWAEPDSDLPAIGEPAR